MEAASDRKSGPVGDGAVTWAASVGNRGAAAVTERSRGCERRQIARRRTEEKGAEAFFPLRAPTTAADPTRDCASSKPKRNSVGPSKYELQGPTV